MIFNVRGHICEAETLTQTWRSTEEDSEAHFGSIDPGEDTLSELDEEEWEMVFVLDSFVEPCGEDGAGGVIQTAPGLEAYYGFQKCN